MTDQPKEEQDVSRPKAKASIRLARAVQQGWAEARTIIVGALAFVSAFLWRDLIKYGVDTLKETKMSKIPGWVASLVVAILFTTLTVIIILLANRETTTTKTLPAPDQNDLVSVIRLLFFQRTQNKYLHVFVHRFRLVQRLRLPDDPIPPPRPVPKLDRLVLLGNIERQPQTRRRRRRPGEVASLFVVRTAFGI